MIADRVSILGTTWKIEVKKAKECAGLKGIGGFCDHTIKTIFIHKQHKHSQVDEVYDLRETERRNLRHEIVHAFFFESGLAYNSSDMRKWAMNEEMIDWIAQQHEKLHRAFVEAGAIDK